MQNINQRIDELRNLMKEKNIDGIFIPSDDYHLSEYVGDYFKEREFISGFTGSAGSVFLSQDEAYLYTDGRYFLQAEEQLKNTYLKLMKLGDRSVITPFDLLKSKLHIENYHLCFDFKVVPYQFGKALEEEIKNNNLTSKLVNEDLVGEIWSSRPKMKSSELFVLEEKYAGQSSNEKLRIVRDKMALDSLTVYILSSLESVMYLYNLRAHDIDFTPVGLSYSLIYQDRAVIYLQDAAVNEKVREYLSSLGVEIKSYFEFYEDIKNLRFETVGADKQKVNYQTLESLDSSNKVCFVKEYVADMKGVKNKVEIRNIKKAHLKDAVAMVKFIYYLKTSQDKKSEISVADKLESFRREQKNFVDLSFATIAGWAEHGAIVHYEATEETNAEITNNNFLLVDSGGHYLEGTTDITRTIVIGKVSYEMKKNFTLVLKSHIDLAKAKFPEGVTGNQIDMIAREPLFAHHLNFNHGTGHGVGYLLSVHEGPQNISLSRANNVPLKEGMITSDEPGLYLTNKYGIRHENLELTVKDITNEFGSFLRFEPLTLVPFDLDAILPSYLDEDEKRYLNNYHALVYKKVSKYLNEDERKFLKKATRKI